MTTVHPAKKLPPLSEAQFMAQVTQYAELMGWSWAHFRPAQTQKGWRTPVSGPLGAGFPDLILVRRQWDHYTDGQIAKRNHPEKPELIWAELKSDSGKVSPQQENVLAILGEVGLVFVWRPADWPEIERVLR